MKVQLLCLLLTSSTCVFSQDFRKPNVSTDIQASSWEESAFAQIKRSEYFFKEFPTGFFGANPKQGLSFNTNGLTIQTMPIAGNKFSKTTLQLVAVKDQKIKGNLAPKQMEQHGNYVKFTYPGFAVEYFNNPDGLRQNFLFSERLSGKGQLSLTLSLKGNLKAVLNSRNELNLLDPSTGKIVLQYDGLKVWDRNGTLLSAKMEIHNSTELKILVDDAHAIYPVTVDPLTHTPEWETSADGVLPGILTDLQLQIDALHGYTVAGVGDINNDGFDDVAIGAPLAIDILAGPTTVVGAGAVFLYFGSATGLPTAPSRILRSNTPVANALFGYSIDAGNVTGSTTAGSIFNDIIIGAPAEAYTASVAGIPATASVTAGKVYIFDGAQLTTGPAAPLLNIYLDGASFFSRGVAGLSQLNINVNALFGMSVAATGDMNGDGLDEVLVGAPGYQRVQLLSVNSGAAFVFTSSNLPTNTPTQLSAPTLVGFPDLINLGGLLFGWSVDGAGDYNMDGQPDIVVGAPGGLNLGGPGMLGGSAYVYTGNGTGINLAIATRLTPNGSVVGSVANLFGFKVKGVKDAAGNRNGNILVGAPLGNVLSDILGGLQLQTGSIYVYNAKPTPTINEIAIQSISSPRGANLLAQLISINVNVSALFGAAIDNMRDVNCDGIGDIIVGEPLSTGLGLIGVDAVGGAASILLGNLDGTYQAAPYWVLENSVSFNAGVNAGSLLGYSVAGAGNTHGALEGVRALVGAPGKALDFGTGLLNLGNTIGTLFSFVAGDNGLGKAYSFAFGCRMDVFPDEGVTFINQILNGNVQTNDLVLPGTTYGVPVADGANPVGAIINLNPDGSYSFTATTAGQYSYIVPICTPEGVCTESILHITVLEDLVTGNPPIANTDIASTLGTTPITLHSLGNDAAGSVGYTLNPASVTITSAASNGITSIDPVTGDITYTANPGFSGNDTLIYQVCDASVPTALCNTAMQVITVQAPGSANSTLAADDFIFIAINTEGSGNVLTNNTDPENNSQTVTPIDSVIAGKGTIQVSANGDFTFMPDPGFSGSIVMPYTVCDNGDPQACASATIHILVSSNAVLPVELISFVAQGQSCKAMLSWKTALESNTKNYEVQVSTDAGAHFITVGTLDANGSNSQYSFIYNMAGDQPHLFRLKMIDVDSRLAYSPLVAINGCNAKNESAFVYPSPVKDVLNLNLQQADLMNTEARIYNLNGQKLMQTRLIGNLTKINVANLVSGIYFIRLQNGTVLKFVKQ